MARRVVITGIGLVSPLGNDLESAWKRLRDGESGITRLTDDVIADSGYFQSRIAGRCVDFVSPPTDLPLLPVKEGKKADRFSQFTCYAGVRAVEQSGIDFQEVESQGLPCASIIGCGVGGLGEIEAQSQKLDKEVIRLKGKPEGGFIGRISPFTIPRIIPNSAASNLAIMYKLHGPSYSIATACASSNNAMIETYKGILLGEYDVALTGGTEAAICRLGMAGFGAMSALSKHNEYPEKASRPFDKDRDGFVM